MANNNNIKSFTAADIEKYHTGQLSAMDMHALEKAALDDPFLADAIEGYLTPGVAIAADLAELRKRLEGKTEKAKVIPLNIAGNRSFPWLRIAVMIVLIAGAGLLSYQFLLKPKTNSIAQVSAKKEASGDSQQKNTVSNISSQTDQLNATESQAAGSGTKITTDSISTKGQIADKKTIIKDANFLNIRVANDSVKKDLTTGDYKLEAIAAPVKKTEENKSENSGMANTDKVAANKSDSIVIGYGTAKRQAPANAEGLVMQEKAKSNVADDKESRSQNEAFLSNPKIFHGKVTDANNNALPFANITNTHDNVGTYSDAKGNFALLSGDSIMTVQVKVVGFENKKINLRTALPTNQIVMQEDKSVAANVLDTVKRNYAKRSRDAAMTFEEPEPADGWPYYDSYLANNLNVPDALDMRKKDGSEAVEVSFEVNKNGEPVNLRIEKSLCDKCDKEAIRLIKEGPKWKRKAKKGKRTTVTIPFTKTD